MVKNYHSEEKYSIVSEYYSVVRRKLVHYFDGLVVYNMVNEDRSEEKYSMVVEG
jgi:hypothetical protein